jgi:Leucine-rich repeat (LRR) protein
MLAQQNMKIHTMLKIQILLIISILTSCDQFGDDGANYNTCENWAADSLVVAQIMRINGRTEEEIELALTKGSSYNDTKCKDGRLTSWIAGVTDSNRIISWLDTIPPIVSSLSNLEQLYMGKAEIPPEIEYMDNLWYIYNVFGKSKELPMAIFDVNSIEDLKIMHGDLKIIDSSICDMPMLKMISFKGNRLNDFPNCSGKLNLDTLDLSDNEYSTIPNSINKIKRLKVLILDGNRICNQDVDSIKTKFGKITVSINRQKCN